MSTSDLVIVLDLEGTLISSAVSQIPRPGLFQFLEACNELADEIVMFTTVPESLFRQIATLLVNEKEAPEWFSHIRYIKWEGQFKELDLVQSNNVIMVDDVQDYFYELDKERLIVIEQFNAANENDSELEVTLEKIKEKMIKDRFSDIDEDDLVDGETFFRGLN